MNGQKKNGIKKRVGKKQKAKLLRDSQEKVMLQLYNAQDMVHTATRENYLFVPESKHFAVFTCKKNLEVLCSRNFELIAENFPCTFEHLFKSFYIIQGYVNGMQIPLVTVTMVNNEFRAYCSIWQFLKFKCAEFGFTLSPQTIQVDMDMQVNYAEAVNSVLPLCHVIVCRSSMATMWYQELHDKMPALLKYYKTKTEIGDWIFALFGLMFLPEDEVSDGFAELISEAPCSAAELMMLPDYILTEYIGEDGEDHVRYPPGTWARHPTAKPRPVVTAEQYVARVHRGSMVHGEPIVWDVVRVLVALQTETNTNIMYFNMFYLPGVSFEQQRITKYNYYTWLEYETGQISRIDYLWRMGKSNNTC